MTYIYQVCNNALVQFPADHILLGKTELTKEAIIHAFGPDFEARLRGVGR